MSESRDKILKKYLKVCLSAAKDEAVFAKFKRIPEYHEVLEHCSYRLGLAHWDNIRHDYFTDEAMMAFLENDKYGSPNKFRFGMFSASPTTIQYISVLSNLITRFGSLQGMRICELGAGYGGQCKILKDMFRVEDYDIIDLYECTLLQQKYLEVVGQGENVFLFTNENYVPQEYDLFISNYAVSEVSPADQLKYVKDICLNSARGYITCNQPLNGMDLISEKYKKTFKISPDIKEERKTNFLITW